MQRGLYRFARAARFLTGILIQNVPGSRAKCAVKIGFQLNLVRDFESPGIKRWLVQQHHFIQQKMVAFNANCRRGRGFDCVVFARVIYFRDDPHELVCFCQEPDNKGFGVVQHLNFGTAGQFRFGAHMLQKSGGFEVRLPLDCCIVGVRDVVFG